MNKIAINGARGKLGSKIVDAIEITKKYQYVGNIEKNEPIPECDIVVCVAGAAGTKELMNKLDSERLVIGSTGDLPLDAISEYSEKHAVILASNFSPGIRLLNTLLQSIDKKETYSYRIDDVHHIHKKDSPSGTALRMQQLLHENNIDAAIHSERSGEVLGVHSLVIKNDLEKITLSHEALSRDLYAMGAIDLIEELATLPPGLYYR